MPKRHWWHWWPKWGWFGLIGVPILGLAWAIDTWQQPWWSNTLTNVGVTSLFIIPAAFIGHSFSKWKENVDERTAAAESKAVTATADADAAKKESRGARTDVRILTDAISASESNLNTLREQLIADQVAESEAEHSIYAALGQRGDRASIIEVLNVGRESGLLSRTGVRAPVWETNLHLRFVFSDEDGEELSVNFEHEDGTVEASHVWAPEVDPLTFYKELWRSVQKLGEYLGAGHFDPTESLERLSEALEYASRYRAHKLRMGSQNVRDIIEFVDGWYITDHGMFAKNHEYYQIAASRLWEMDWESHISGKSWGDDDNIVIAISVARAIHAAKRPPVKTAAG